MRLVVLLAIPGLLVLAIEQPSSVRTPYRRLCLALDEFVKIELRVETVGLRSRVADEALVIQRFRHLCSCRYQNLSRSFGDTQAAARLLLLTSRTRFGGIRRILEPDFCSSTVVSGRGFLQGTSFSQVGDPVRDQKLSSPFLGRLGRDLRNQCFWRQDALLEENQACGLIKKSLLVPLESND